MTLIHNHLDQVTLALTTQNDIDEEIVQTKLESTLHEDEAKPLDEAEDTMSSSDSVIMRYIQLFEKYESSLRAILATRILNEKEDLSLVADLVRKNSIEDLHSVTQEEFNTRIRKALSVIANFEDPHNDALIREALKLRIRADKSLEGVIFIDKRVTTTGFFKSVSTSTYCIRAYAFDKDLQSGKCAAVPPQLSLEDQEVLRDILCIFCELSSKPNSFTLENGDTVVELTYHGIDAQEIT